MNLLLIDGSNITMRAAFGGDIEPERATTIATGLVERAMRQSQATHMVICMDSECPSWRKQKCPDYKAHRTTDTAPWIRHSFEQWTRAGWYVEECAGFEADDIIATLAERHKNERVFIASNDSDLLCLARKSMLLRPQNGGVFEEWTVKMVRDKYGVAPELLPHYKAIVGEPGDNIKGVPGIGPKGAVKLLSYFGSLKTALKLGSLDPENKLAKKLAAHQDAALTALELTSLRFDAPVSITDLEHCKIA